MPQRNPRFKRLKLGAWLFALLALTQAWEYDCGQGEPYNAITGAPGVFVDCGGNEKLCRDETQKPGSEPDIATLQVTPDGPLFMEVGEVRMIHVAALDGHGDPVVDTEAAVYTGMLDTDVIEHVWSCFNHEPPGGDFDDSTTDQEARDNCNVSFGTAELMPAYFNLVNDGQLWLGYEAISPGETRIWISYPGTPEGWITCGGTRGNCDEPPTAEHIAWIDVVVCAPGGCPDEPADSDGDGVSDEDDLCPGTPDGTAVDEDGCPLPDEPEDSDGDGVVDEDDLCPGTPDGTTVDEDGCPLPDDDHPTIDQIAPSSYIFRGTETSNACGFTDVSEDAAAASSNEGGIMPLKIQTFFPANDPGPAPTTTVQGPYDPDTGEYLANGTSAVGAEHDLEGVWTLDMNGSPRFDGVLTERFLSPVCENTFDVTYSID